jgi:predicted acyl esterase
MVGNSWLAVVQWFIAAERPPHLTCIAPLEGLSDLYREAICRGGVPCKPFWGFLQGAGLFGGIQHCEFSCYTANTFEGKNQQEDILGMLEKYPFVNEYWEDKRAKMEKINIPAYVLASFSTGLHTVGSFRGFEDLPTKNKWQVEVLLTVLKLLTLYGDRLRVHPTQEWHDLYSSECVEDLQRYFDHFLR